MPNAVSSPIVTPVRVSGNPVRPGTQLLPTVPYTQALQIRLDDVAPEAYSRDTKELLTSAAGGYSHGFVAAAQAAYAGHYPLVLSPDMIWLLIAQGFALHVRENAEALRHHFVAHSGQLDLRVYRTDFIRGFAGNDWEGVFSKFSAQIRQRIGSETHDTLVPRFPLPDLSKKPPLKSPCSTQCSGTFASTFITSVASQSFGLKVQPKIGYKSER